MTADRVENRTGSVTDVAKAAVLEVPERYPGYREHLVAKLTEIIGEQTTGAGKTMRRNEIRKILEAFSRQVAANARGTEE